MGVTIHYEGKVRNEAQYRRVMDAATSFAEDHALDHAFFNNVDQHLIRVIDNRIVEYASMVKGMVIQPGEGCESFFLDFDENGFVQNFCKTQFAETRIHLLVIGLLRHIEPFLDEFKVTDEGGYWESEPAEKIQAKKNFLEKAIDNIKVRFAR
jgi:hypothetical protein